MNGSRLRPSEVVASGNTAMQPPSCKALASCSLTRLASRRLLRSMKRVPAFLIRKPASGQSRSSFLATKRDTVTLLSAKMSSHEMWLATTSVLAGYTAGGVPWTRTLIARMCSRCRDQRWVITARAGCDRRG
ncbi:hypothetical protein D3C78_1607400 [compost metagenome]